MNRYLIGCAAAALMATFGTACGAEESASAYCESFADARSSFQAMAAGEMGEFGTAINTFHGLADQAPPEIMKEWGTLDGAFVSLEKGLEAAGLSVDELEKVTTGDLPKDVDLAKLEKLMATMQELGSKDFTVAADTIEQHGEDECGVDLTAS